MTSDSGSGLHVLREIFDLFDKNKNGEIKVSELRAMMQCLGENPTKKDVKKLIKQYDLNNDGTINFQEFCEMMKDQIKTVESKQSELKDAFKAFDKNGDGKISSSELMEAMTNLGEKMTMDEVKEMLKEVDSNDDGFIEYGEFVRMYCSE